MPFKPGSDPNRNLKGRPRVGNSVAEGLRVYMEGKEDKKTRIQKLVEHLYQSAIGDNPVPAARLILETLGMLNIEDEASGGHGGVSARALIEVLDPPRSEEHTSELHALADIA